MKEPIWLVRVIECFSNNTDEFVSEVALPTVELAELQRTWNEPPDAPMVDCYSMREEHALFFQELVSIEFDFTQYSYFLTAYTTDWEATKREGGYMGLFPPQRDLPASLEARHVAPKSPD